MSQIKQRTNKISKITMSTALVASSFSFVAPLASASQFADVKQSNSHYEAIINLAGRGIINGYEDGTFKPGNFVTRAHAAKIIARTLNLDTTNVVDPKFKDVNKNSEYYPYIAALANAGIINGFDGKFNPSGNVTRGQMSKIIARAFGVSSTGDLSFKDVPATHEYAGYISALAENGITLGKEDGKFAMHELVTRGQLASFVTRAEKIDASMQIIGLVQSIEGNSIKIANKTYRVSSEHAFLVAAENREALQDAELTFTVKNNEIIDITSIEIYNGEDFDGKNYAFDKVLLSKTIKDVKNVASTEIFHELPTVKVSYNNVSAKKLFAKASTVAVASLNNIVAVEQQSSLFLTGSNVEELELDARSVSVEIGDDSTVANLLAPTTSSINLIGNFTNVVVPANVHLTGQGSIGNLVSDGSTGSGISVSPQLTVGMISLGGTQYTWDQAVTNLNVNSSLNTNPAPIIPPPSVQPNPGPVIPSNPDPIIPTPPVQPDPDPVPPTPPVQPDPDPVPPTPPVQPDPDPVPPTPPVQPDPDPVPPTPPVQLDPAEVAKEAFQGELAKIVDKQLAFDVTVDTTSLETAFGIDTSIVSLSYTLGATEEYLITLTHKSDNTLTETKTVTITKATKPVDPVEEATTALQKELAKVTSLELAVGVEVTSAALVAAYKIDSTVATLMIVEGLNSNEYLVTLTHPNQPTVTASKTVTITKATKPVDPVEEATTALQKELAKVTSLELAVGVEVTPAALVAAYKIDSTVATLTVIEGSNTDEYQVTLTHPNQPTVTASKTVTITKAAKPVDPVEEATTVLQKELAKVTSLELAEGVEVTPAALVAAYKIDSTVATLTVVEGLNSNEYLVTLTHPNQPTVTATKTVTITKATNSGGDSPTTGTQKLNEVPTVSPDGTVKIGDDERKVDSQTASALQALQKVSSDVAAMSLTMELGENDTAKIAGVEIQASNTAAPLNLNDVPADLAVKIQANNQQVIEGLRNTANVTIEANGHIEFTNSSLDNITLINATTVTGLTATTLVAQNTSSMTFDSTSSIGTAQFNNVAAVTGLRATEATFETIGDVNLTNVEVATLIINETSGFAGNTLQKIAALNAFSTFANSSQYKITLAGSAVTDLIINREDAIIDIQTNTNVSTVTINSNNVGLAVNKVANVRVLGDVSYLTLGTPGNPATIDNLSVKLTADVYLAGYATISNLVIESGSTGTVIGKDSTVTVNAGMPTPTLDIKIVPTMNLAKFTFTNVTADYYYVQHNAGSTPSNTIAINGSTKKYDPNGIVVDLTTEIIAFYDGTGQKVGEVYSKPATRTYMEVLKVQSSKLKIDVANADLSTMANRMKYLIVYNHETDSGVHYLQNNVYQMAPFPSTYKITTVSDVSTLEVPISGISTTANLIIFADDFVYDTVAKANKDMRVLVLKDLAQRGNTKAFYDYLTFSIGLENKQYDSIFLSSIMDEILNNNISTIEGIVAHAEQKMADVKYNKTLSLNELLLGSGITKESHTGTNSVATIEGSNLLLESKTAGTDIIEFKDTAGNISLLKVVVNPSAATDAEKITTELIKKEVPATAEILHGDARLTVSGGKTYLIPATLGTNTFIYTPGATTATFGTIQSAVTDGSYVYNLNTVTPTKVSKAALNLAGAISRQKLTKSGYVTTDTDLYFYVLDSAATGVLDQYDITADGKSTAVAIVENSGSVSAVVASKAFGVADLGFDQVKSIEKLTIGSTMHTAFTNEQVDIYAAKASANTAFKVTSQDDKVTLINGVVTSTNGVQLTSSNVVKLDLTSHIGSASIILPRKADNSLKEDVIRFVGNEAYATATGTSTQRVVLTDGKQLDVKVTQAGAGYTMSVETVSQVAINAADLHLQNINAIQTNGTSATAVSVNNTMVSITANANQSGKTELIVTDSDGKKAIVYVNVATGSLKDMNTATAGDQLYKVAKQELSATDLGFGSTPISSVSVGNANARGVVAAGKAIFYATAAGTATFTVKDEDNKETLVNVGVARDAGTNEMVVTADPVVLTATQTIDPDAVGNQIVRIEGNDIYALKEGTVDLAIKDKPALFYRVTVVKDSVTGHYSFEDPEVVSKAVYSATELGLTDITSATSSNESIATVAFESNKIVVTTQIDDGTGYITVIGSNGRAFVYMEKVGNVLTTTIEKAIEKVDVSLTGLTNISGLKDWSNDNIVRSYEAGTKIDFFAIQDQPLLGETAYTVTDSTGKKTIINVPVTKNAAGNREIVPEIVRAEISSSPAEIISGSSIRLYAHDSGDDQQQYAYAVGLGDTLVKLEDGTLVNYTVDIEDGLYTVTSEEVTNGLTVSAEDLDLTGNVTISGIGTSIATAVAKNDKITFQGIVKDGETSILVSDATHTVRAKVVIVDGEMTVETLKYELPTNAVATNIHESAKDIAWIAEDGKTVYVLKDGEFHYIVKNSAETTSKVQKLTIGKTGTAYTLSVLDKIPSVFKSTTELGLVSALQVQSGYNDEIIYAGMIAGEFVAYQIADGSTDVVVKDGQGQSTLIHFTSNKDIVTPANSTLTPQIAIAKKANDTAFTFEKSAYDLSTISNVIIHDLTIAERHANNQLYLLKQGTTYATIDDGAGNKALATIVVTKPTNQLVAMITPVVKTAAELASGATTVTALPGTQTDSSIVRVVNNKVYAVGVGETKVKLNNQIVNILVKEEANTYTITIGTAVNFIEIPLAAGTFTVADVTNTNSTSVIKDDNGTPANTLDDKLIISVTGLNGSTDITITSGTIKTLYHVKVENGEFVNLRDPALTADKYVKASTTLTTAIAGLEEASDDNDVIQINSTDLHLLKEGKAALKGTDGLVNVEVTRNNTKNYFEATQTVVQKEVKEVFTEDTKFAYETADGKKYIRALQAAAYPVEGTYYTTNYRIAAKTDLIGGEFVLTVQERNMKKVDFESYGLTHIAGDPITLLSDNEDIAKAEMVNGELFVYAGAGQSTPAGTTTITATDKDDKQISIKVTRAEGGTISYEVAGAVDAIKFVEDLGLDLDTLGTITVTDYNAAIVQANVTATGISLAAQTTGTTSLFVKQNGAVVAIVNISVADGKAIASVVKYDGTDLTDVITGDVSISRQGSTVFYATGEGVVLYDKETTATQLRIVKNTETNLYSITPTSFKLNKFATSTDLPITAATTVNIANSSVADAFVANNQLYIVGKSLGSTDILVTTGANKAVVHAHMKVDGLSSKVAAFEPTVITGTFTGNDWIQVRNDKLFALAVRTSTIKVDGTLVTAEVTRKLDNEFDVKLTRVKHEFTGTPTPIVKLVSNPAATEDDVVKITDTTLYAKAEGETQVFVDGVVRDVEVVGNADGTFKFVVTDAKVQTIIAGADLGLTLTAATPVQTTPITGSNILSTQIIDNKLYVYALGTGSAELTVDGKAVVHIAITSTNNVLQIEESIASTTIETAGTLAALKIKVDGVDVNDPKIRLHQKTGEYEVFGLQEGISLVKETVGVLDTLRKVLIVRENNVLKVSSAVVEKDFLAGNLSAINNSIVRGGTGKLIAKATGTVEFVYNGTTYRVTVDAAGEMTIDVLDTQEIDLTGILTSITGTPSSTLLDLVKDGTKLSATATAEGSEIIKVIGSPNTVLVKVDVTKDSNNNYLLAYEILQTELTTTELGFYPKTIEAITNGITKINGSNVTIYPGTTVGKQYFKVTGEGGTQAIYSLDIATGGVKLEGGQVTGYTVAPLHHDISISELGFNPTQIAIDGTAKYSIKTKNGVEVLEVILNNTDKSYIIVRGEGGVYKSLEVKATADGSNNYTTAHIIHDTLKLDAITVMSPTGNAKSVNDGTISVLYATAVGKFAYENNGKLYNSEVTLSGAKYTFATSTTIDVDLENARLVDGEDIVQGSGTDYYASKLGTAVYATATGYKKVVVAVINDEIKATVTNLYQYILPSTVKSGVVLKAPNSVKVDANNPAGITIYSEVAPAVDTAWIIKTFDEANNVTLYKAEENADTSLFEFKAITANLFEATGWIKANTTIESVVISDETVARRVGNDLYFLRAGDVTVTITTSTGLKRVITYEVEDLNVEDSGYDALLDYKVSDDSAETKDIIYYSTEVQNYSQKEQITLTFDVNVNLDSFIDLLVGTETNEFKKMDEVELRIRVTSPTAYTVSFNVVVPEYGASEAVNLKITPVDFENKEYSLLEFTSTKIQFIKQ